MNCKHILSRVLTKKIKTLRNHFCWIDKLIIPLQHKFAGIKYNNGKDMHH